MDNGRAQEAPVRATLVAVAKPMKHSSSIVMEGLPSSRCSGQMEMSSYSL
jgi:hypothetical protein